MAAAFELTEEGLAINVPAGQFTDVLVDGWQITPEGTHAGRLDVAPWSEERIAAFHDRMRTHQRYGRRLRRLYLWLDPWEGWERGEDEEQHRVRARAAKWLNHRFAVNPPPDRTKMLSNCMVLNGKPPAFGITLADT